MSDGEAMSDSHDCCGDAAAYVLGALEPAEAERFRRHLEECSVCREEVDSLQGAVRALPMAAPQHPLPRRLRRRVLRAIRDEPRSAASAPAPRRPRRARPRLALRPALATLGAALVVAGAVVAGIELSGGGRGARVIPARVTGVAGSAELRVSGGRAELVVRHLSLPPPGHVYEVWLKLPGRPPRPASVLFSVSASGGADVGLPGSLRGISQVMVTPEPAGGSPVPTHAPVIVARVS